MSILSTDCALEHLETFEFESELCDDKIYNVWLACLMCVTYNTSNICTDWLAWMLGPRNRMCILKSKIRNVSILVYEAYHKHDAWLLQ
jgi:hypothetical protein